MILYRKDFPLRKGISFTDYIKALEQETIPSFAFIIEEASTTEKYRAKLIYTWSFGQSGMRTGFVFGGVLLSECEILHSEGERFFTLQASPTGINLFMFLAYLIGASLLFIFGLITFISYNTVTFQNIAILLLVTAVLSIPSIDLYRYDKKLLNKIGAIGMEPGKK
jgi:hypothetical protein